MKSLFHKLESRTVYSFRMITGEEVIAKIATNMNKISEPQEVTIASPRVLIAHLKQDAKGNAVFAAQILNWINAAPDADVTIYAEDVVAVAQVDKQIEQEYIRFTTGIELIS